MRPRKEFSREQVDTVRRLQFDGAPRGEIARSLNITTAQYAWHLQTGKFGFDLPKVRGRGGRPKREDDESTGQVFGCPQSEWVRRKEEIRDNWPPSVEADRRHGRMPNRANNYSLFEQGRDPNKQQPNDTRQSPRNW